MVDPAQLAQFVANGVVIGSILTLAAVGLTLVYGILHLANFAHGDMITLGAYLGLFFTALVPGSEAALWAIGAAALLVAGIAFDRVVGPRLLDSSPSLRSTEVKLGLYAVLLLGAILLGIRFGVGPEDGWIPALALATAGIGLGWSARRRIVDTPDAAAIAAAGAGAVIVLGFVIPQASPFGTLPEGWVVVLTGLPLAGLPFAADRDVFSHGPARAGVAVAGLLVGLALGSRFVLGAMLAILVTVSLMIVVDLTIWRYLRKREAGLLTLIIVSIGLALILRNSVVIKWSTSLRTFPGPVEQVEAILGTGISLTPNQVLVVVVAGVAIALTHVMLRYTRTGKAMRALADNVDLARITGIDVDRIILYVWMVAASLAALAGILLGQTRPIDPNIGWFLLLPIFAAVILGGIGSPYGAMAGGMVIGIAMETAFVFGIPSAYRLGVGFVIMIITLLIRPEGIAGRARG